MAIKREEQAWWEAQRLLKRYIFNLPRPGRGGAVLDDYSATSRVEDNVLGLALKQQTISSTFSVKAAMVPPSMQALVYDQRRSSGEGRSTDYAHSSISLCPLKMPIFS